MCAASAAYVQNSLIPNYSAAITPGSLPACNAATTFRGFKRETTSPLRQPVSAPDPKMARLVEIWNGSKSHNLKFAPDLDLTHRGFMEAVLKLGCTQGEIQEFIRTLVSLQGEDYFSIRAGLLVSALIQVAPDARCEIDLRCLSIPLDYVCYCCSDKEIVVHGDAGSYAAYNMRNCKLALDGNVGPNSCRRASSSVIVVNGDADAFTGAKMSECNLAIRGNSRSFLGMDALNSVITVEGNTHDLAGWRSHNCTLTLRGRVGNGTGKEMCDGTIHLNRKAEVGTLSDERVNTAVLYDA